jgi:hypothetical protein
VETPSTQETRSATFLNGVFVVNVALTSRKFSILYGLTSGVAWASRLAAPRSSDRKASNSARTGPAPRSPRRWGYRPGRIARLPSGSTPLTLSTALPPAGWDIDLKARSGRLARAAWSVCGLPWESCLREPLSGLGTLTSCRTPASCSCARTRVCCQRRPKTSLHTPSTAS